MEDNWNQKRKEVLRWSSFRERTILLWSARWRPRQSVSREHRWGKVCSKSEALLEVRCVRTQGKPHVGLKSVKTLLAGGLERKTNHPTSPQVSRVFWWDWKADGSENLALLRFCQPHCHRKLLVTGLGSQVLPSFCLWGFHCSAYGLPLQGGERAKPCRGSDCQLAWVWDTAVLVQL